jgi:hypothetical protein
MISSSGEFLDAALKLGHHGTAVFPLAGKIPRIPNPHPKGSPERLNCKGECGQLGHGYCDATTELGTIGYWWGVLYRGANIGARVPKGMFVLDIDPRHNGHESLAIAADDAYVPQTLTTIRERRGAHYLSPATGEALNGASGPGIDIKTSLGYTVRAPSIHPDSGKPHVHHRPVVDPRIGWSS